MWEYGLANYPAVPVEAGLNRRLSYMLPGRIPKTSACLLNASSSREHWECIGLPDLLVRNAASYPYSQPNTRIKWRGRVRDDQFMHERHRAAADVSQFQKRFKDHGIPKGMLKELLLQENKVQESNLAARSDHQGNALAAIHHCDCDVLFHPTGATLEKLQCRRRRHTHWKATCDTPIDLVNTIQQIEVFGDVGGTASVAPLVLARGAAAINVVSLTSSLAFQSVETVAFPSLLYHAAASPHVDAELSCLSIHGKLFSWTPESGAQVVGHAAPPQRWVRCEYSSHPCVLWVANRHAIGTYDYRTPAPNGFNTDWLWNMPPSTNEIVDSRASSCPFQMVVRTAATVDILDVRSPHKSLLQWRHASLFPTQVSKPQTTIGTVDVVDVSTSTKARALILSGSASTNKSTVHWYTGTTTDTSGMETLSTPHAATAYQAAAADAPFDIYLPDDTAWIHQIGARVLHGRHSTSSCDIFQLTSLGDVYVQAIQLTDAPTIQVQDNLRSGRVMRAAHPADVTTTPVPARAFLPEYDAETLRPFRLLPTAKFAAAIAPVALPLLPDTSPDTKPPNDDDIGFRFAQFAPACTVAMLLQTWPDGRPSFERLVAAIEDSTHPRLSLRFVSPHRRFDASTYHVQLPFGAVAARLVGGVCACDPSHPTPYCAHPSCPVPHAWVVAQDVSTCIQTTQPLPYGGLFSKASSHMQVVEDLLAVYGQARDIPMSPRRLKRRT
ncbi:Aste57867_22334 [Aphanomyces stellatus]|uniref:Aste57867_22334 protein n=1 Tax=Aphanomyces stellatus TaxID=120398 RepID=A0A485LKJ9_9STRA|nr:hypothetical protein As57867_022264 [Aphanomyces stellatus]VFT98997.1 Aste57867_22334 [Aphanomyces stellatus]